MRDKLSGVKMAAKGTSALTAATRVSGRGLGEVVDGEGAPCKALTLSGSHYSGVFIPKVKRALRKACLKG